MDSTEPIAGSEPQSATGRPLRSFPTVARDVAGSDSRQIYRGNQIHRDFWATPPTGPRVSAPAFETITVDVPTPNEIAAAKDVQPVRVEDALYNIAAVPVDRLPGATIRSAGLNGEVAADSSATIELEGPTQAWVEIPAQVAVHNDGAAGRTIEAQVVTDTRDSGTDYYSAALRLTEPRRAARTDQHPGRAPVGAHNGRPPLPATQLNTDVLEGPAPEWSHDGDTTPLTNGDAVPGDLGPKALEPATLPQPATDVVEPDAGLVVAAENGTRSPSWALAAAIEPCAGQQAATTDAPAKETVVRHRPWKQPR